MIYEQYSLSSFIACEKGIVAVRARGKLVDFIDVINKIGGVPSLRAYLLLSSHSF